MAIFILEIVVKLVAEGNRPFQFFTDAWNVFDFLIVVVGLLPFGGSAVTALRLVRLLRVLKLVSSVPTTSTCHAHRLLLNPFDRNRGPNLCRTGCRCARCPSSVF